MELSFANGVQEYTVHGVKGDARLSTAFLKSRCVTASLAA